MGPLRRRRYRSFCLGSARVYHVSALSRRLGHYGLFLFFVTVTTRYAEFPVVGYALAYAATLKLRLVS
jgi:hypothetical protein